MKLVKPLVEVCLILFNAVCTSLCAAPVNERFFGLHALYLDKAYQDGERSSWPFVKFGSWRVWNSFVSWAELQPSEDLWDFARLDRYVAWAEKAKVEVTYTLGRTPQWAFARPNDKCDRRYSCAAEEPDLRYWETYVRTLARRYRGRIGAYEIWNEPAFSEVDPLYRPDGRPIQYFAGSASQMTELARIAYQTIKDEDHSAIVVSPGVTSEGDGLRRLETYLKAGGGQWADVIAFHFYVSPPEDAYWQVLRVKQLLIKYGLGSKPIWNTEMGYVYAKDDFGVVAGSRTGRWTDVLDQKIGAAYVARSLILMAAADIQRVHWFNWDGDPPHPTMGIAARRGKGETPMTSAYSKVQAWLVDSADIQCGTNFQAMWICTVHKNGGTQWIIWAAKDAGQLDLSTLGKGPFLIDRLLSTDLTQVSGTNKLAIDAAPILVRQN